MTSIANLKQQIVSNEDKIEMLSDKNQADMENFVKFAISFVNNLGQNYFEVSPDKRNRCKQLIFTGEIYVDLSGNVYTNNISPIFRGQELKKDTEVSNNSQVVQNS